MSEEKEQLEIDESNPVQTKEAEGANTIDEKKLLRKLDLHLLPGVTLLYLLSFLDRSNGDPPPSSPRLHLIPFQLEMPVSKVWPQTQT